jgi:hypothetical protein
MSLYRTQNSYGFNNNYDLYDQRNQQQMQLNRQNQKLQIHYDMLGKVLQSAENFAMIANNIHGKKYFKYYDSFNNAETKNVDQARTEFISSMEFLQCGLNRYKKNYSSFQLPNDIDVLQKIKKFKEYFPPGNYSDRKLFDDLENIVTGKITGNYDAGNYYEYNDPRSNEGKANLWSSQGPRIVESVNQRHKEIEENFAKNPYDKPKLYVGHDKPANNYLQNGFNNFSKDDKIFNGLENIYQKAKELFYNRKELYKNKMFNNRYQQLLEEVKQFENKFYDPKMFQISLPSDKNIKIKELENWKNQLATDYSYNYFFANYTQLFIKIKNLFSDN